MLDDIKQYLGVDFDDDNALISSLILAAYGYLNGAIGKGYDRSDPRVHMLVRAIVYDLYENRGAETSECKVSAGTDRMINNLTQQLRLEMLPSDF